MTGAPVESSDLDACFTRYLALSHIIAVPANSPLAPLPGEAPEESPVYYVARAAWGATHVAIQPTLPPTLRDELVALDSPRAFDDPRAVLALLAQHGVSCHTVWLGRTSRFPADLDPALAAGVVALPSGLDVYGEEQPAPQRPQPEAPGASAGFVPRQFAIIADGLVVATCESSRESQVAAEAWVRTLPAYRGRGYARRVVATWAADARMRAKEPFYSHHRDNLDSAAVARALGLVLFLEDAGYL